MSDEESVVASGWRTNAVRSADVETVRRGGREYIQFPLVPLTEMVYDYPENGTREYLPAENIRETAGLWDGTLLTYVHPQNRDRTVRDPDQFMDSVIGAFHNPDVLDGGEKLRGSGLIDVEKAKSLGGPAQELVTLLQNGEQVSVSAGYSPADVEHTSGSYDGDQYDLVQGAPLPDHIAIFPSDSAVTARCSPEDGCAAPRANASSANANGVSSNMSNDTNANEQRQLINEMVDTLDMFEEEASDAHAEKAQRLRDVAHGLDESAKEGADVTAALKPLVEEMKALSQDIVETEGRENAGVCNCNHGGSGTCRCSTSTDAGAGQSSVNMSTVPGTAKRNVGREAQRQNADDYPAGGRKAWERRAAGLEETPGEPEMPAGGRQAYERRKAGVDQTPDDEMPAGGRRAWEQRQNASDAVDANQWKGHDYPLTHKRHLEAEAEKERRWSELRENARRNSSIRDAT